MAALTLSVNGPLFIWAMKKAWDYYVLMSWIEVESKTNGGVGNHHPPDFSHTLSKDSLFPTDQKSAGIFLIIQTFLKKI